MTQRWRDRRPREVVVVGYGMVGARFVEEVRRRDPDAARVRLTVLGSETHRPYNRVLLSRVLAGELPFDRVGLQAADWAERHRVDVRLGTTVLAVNRFARTVTTAGGTLRYDDLVLATGSRPFVPDVAGLTTATGDCAPDVAVLRTVDDCRRILALAAPGARVAVLGGGVLGLEAARGLARHGVAATVVHPAPHLMQRQLDGGASAVLRRRLRELGVTVRLGVLARRWLPGHGLELDDGTTVACDAVVVTAGVSPDTALAREAGLALAPDGGIVVDDRLRTSDPRVRALGDCAAHPGTVAGLVQPGWEQAAVLADLLCGTDPAARYRGTRPVTRLKVQGVDLTSVGDVHAGPDADDAGDDAGDGTRDGAATETLSFSDPARCRYARLVVRDDRVAGAVMLGLPDAAAQLVGLYDRGAPVPADRLAVLLGRALPPEAESVATPALMPDRTLLCRCNGVTKGALTTAWLAGARSVDDLAAATRATTGCGSCRDVVTGVAEWLERADPQEPSDRTEGAA